MPPWMDCVMLVNVYHPSIISGLTGWVLSKSWHDLPGLTINSLLSYPCPTRLGMTVCLNTEFVAPYFSTMELGKAIIFTVTWPSFSGWQGLCTLTALCGSFPFSIMTVLSYRRQQFNYCDHKASLIKQACNLKLLRGSFQVDFTNSQQITSGFAQAGADNQICALDFSWTFVYWPYATRKLRPSGQTSHLSPASAKPRTVTTNAKKTDDTARQWLKMDTTYRPYLPSGQTLKLTVFCYWDRWQKRKKKTTLRIF